MRQGHFASLLPVTLVIVFLVWAISQCLFVQSDGSLATKYTNVWGDWSLHVAHAWWFAEQPMARWFSPVLLFYDKPTVYPPLINFSSGMLLRSGLGLQSAMLLPSLIAGVVLVSGLFALFRRYVNSSWGAACLAILIFFAGGTRTLATVISRVVTTMADSGGNSQGLVDGLMSGVVGEQIGAGLLKQVWLVPLYGLFLPQRTLMAGMALGVLTLLGLLRYQDQLLCIETSHSSERLAWPWLLFFLIMFPLVALAHFHSMLVLLGLAISIPFAAVLLPVRRGVSPRQHSVRFIRDWLKIVLPGFMLGLVVLAMIIARASEHVSALAFETGWMNQSQGQQWLIFWLINWGIFLPLVLVAVVTSSDFRRDPLFLSGFCLFCFVNLFRIHPWSWDSSKILIWSMLLLALPFSRFVVSLNRKWVTALIVILIGMDGIIATSLRAFNKMDSIVLWTASELVIADWTRKNIAKDALILSPSNTDHRFWAYSLTGRKNVLAYGGWLWTHGLPLEPMGSRVNILLKNPSENLSTLRSMGVSHIAAPELIGPVEIGFTELKRDFNLLFSFENQALFSVPSIQ